MLDRDGVYERALDDRDLEAGLYDVLLFEGVLAVVARELALGRVEAVDRVDEGRVVV